MSAPSDPRVAVTIHMLISLDGKTNGSVMETPRFMAYGKEYNRVDHEIFKPKTQVVLCGRRSVSDLEFEDPKNYPAADKKGDRSDFHADLATNPAPADKHYFAVIDPHGRLGWKSSLLSIPVFPGYDGDRIVEVLVEDLVSDEYLAHLRKVNVPYIFAGKSTLDCRLVADKLGKLFHVDRVICHGGGTINGTFLEQGAVDNLSLILMPAVSGEPEAVPLFNPMAGSKLPVTDFDLEQVEKLPEGALWLYYARKAQ